MEDKSYFAPAQRSSSEEILKEQELVASQKFFNEIFGSVTVIGAVIDKNRQIVYSNNDFLAMMGINSLEHVLGKRPGEIISCIHSGEETAGCGTSKSCAFCGAVNAILESQKTGLKSEKETRISATINGKFKCWDLKVTSTPIVLSGDQFYIFTLQDISDEKRRLALERIFFHDLLNSAGGLNGLLNILKEGNYPEDAKKLIDMSEEISRDIIEEIILHRQIRAAENSELFVNIEPVHSREIIESAIRKIISHDVGQNRHIAVEDHSVDIEFETDRILFQRVMINILKNALEATKRDGTVLTGIETRGDTIRFWVKNDQVIPEDIQLQLFQRSFSTKGEGRGIGTYSIKLLTENYLKGKVSFLSTEKDGTIFSIELGKKWTER